MKPNFKPVASDKSNLFKVVVQENEKEFEYPWHYHPEFELTYILTCHGLRYVGNSLENFYEDDLVLLGSNLPHCWINTPDQTQPASAVVVYLKEEILDDTWMQCVELEGIRKLMELSNQGIAFTKSVALSVKDKLLQLPNLPPFERLMHLLQILQELSEAKDYRILCEHGYTYELNQSNNERVNKIYKYLEQHYKEKISLNDVAAEVNMRAEYFSRFFSKVMKKSFFEFLNEYKINKACKLLIETDKQISEICYASGFETIPFFYRQFKKFKKCQPKNYRSSYLKALS